jgi:hypothetical protein
MTESETWRGPALQQIDRGDDAALAHLRAEQRARLQFVRESELWDWLGGVPGWELYPSAMWGTFAFLALVPVAILTAGFTRGPVLLALCALAVAALVPQLFVYLPRRRRIVARYRRAELAPAIAFAAEPEASDPENRLLRSVWALVAPPGADANALRALDAAAQKVRALLDAGGEPAGELLPFVAAVRRDVAARAADGSREPAPAVLGRGLEYARLRVSPNYLPDERLTTRLLFVFRDPADAGPGGTRVVQSSMWGEGIGTLCGAFPWEASR